MLRHHNVTFSGSELLVGGVIEERRSQRTSKLLGLKQCEAGWVGVSGGAWGCCFAVTSPM